MKHLKKVLCLILAITMGISMFACSGDNQTKAPYYSSNKQFNFWGYTGPTDGTYTIDGEMFYIGEDFRTVERFIEYKEAGMNIYFPQSAGGYNGQTWANSAAKMVMDRAAEAGFDRVILTDYRIQSLSNKVGSIIGEGKIQNTQDDKFADETALDAHIEALMQPYKDHPAFYGVMLMDEPSYAKLQAVGEVYRSIKRVRPETFVQCCLFPPVPALNATVRPTENYTNDTYENWKKYLERFLDATGADYIMYDQYPISTNGIHLSYMKGLRIAAELCTERNVSFKIATQTIDMQQPTARIRAINESDGYWLTNMLMGFGVDTAAFFTYWTKQTNSTNGEMFFDDGSFVNRDGTKTEIYYFMQNIMAEMQQLAPTILNFKYQNSAVYNSIPVSYVIAPATIFESDEFNVLKNVDIDRETALVTELKDENNNQYMYMVQNIIEGIIPAKSTTLETITLTFDKNFTNAVVFDKGERKIVKLKDNKITLKLQPGQANFIMPY